MKDKIQQWYDWDFWTAQQVQDAADKGVITQKEANEILGIQTT